jgi:serine/threonine protein kinase
MTDETLFQEALSRSAQERAAFLEQACNGRPELRATVEALLAAHEKPADACHGRGPATGEYPLPDAPTHPTMTTTAHQPTIGPGAVVAGRYTLVEKIGEGGMGDVWVARQSEPVKRQVALKLIKAGMDTRAVLQRFEQERQALALMEHPNIARVIDGGMTAEHKPFFVMELVNGPPLTRFCDEAQMGIRERLELFAAICQAVQHAHQKGIIHRDLKPANILVTILDGKHVPKIIDFGVAKATAGRLTDESLSTQLGAVVGTLEYMSPEQAGFSGEDIDTRTDIYSLGVILYELLTGLRPLDARRPRKAALTEMIRLIKEEEPARPSTRFSTDESALSAAAVRQTEPKKLAALLRGELDWVVMKCLEKQRDRRYETANGLARDIQRYLANEVVEARPPSAGYRLRKFVRRNRAMVAVGSALAAALLIGVVAFAWQAQIANRQRRIAQENEQRANANFLMARQAVDDYLTRVSENTLLKVQPSRDLRELRKGLLEDALKFYRSFIDQHQEDSSLRRELARAYARVAKITDEIGSRPDAMAGYSRAIEIQRALADAEPDDPTLGVDVAQTLIQVGSLHRSMGRSSSAIAAWEEADGMLDEVVRSRPDSREARLLLAKAGSMLGASYKES